jgi:hypothetical protein
MLGFRLRLGFRLGFRLSRRNRSRSRGLAGLLRLVIFTVILFLGLIGAVFSTVRVLFSLD